MNINSINSTVAFKSNKDYDNAIPAEYIVIEDTADSFEKTKKNPTDIIEKGVKATAVGTAAVPTALLIGNAATNKIEKVAVEFCSDFADDAAKAAKEQVSGTGIKKLLGKIKNFSTEAITELPKRTKAGIKWGVAGVAAAVLTYLGTKDEDNDGKSDLIEAIKKFANPA